ncbi:MAG: hypothetical protein A2233_05225 [Candidatus Kerfeldbacteria bacterium RIFOXYA2_FULL_38_24]|uniref:Glycosyl transferase family 1 n=1 Tax=Candidatus Kerfeldbacteria bacterium RIFOXYB2_FULL_38_14 TaxID=1798547 RepID=A0A1G2BG84_9BACT|nr:MAG: hypothetical protein A2233_05225 [Candidatus Kerfeldbacteria bacterium RIFOXYA2_FULL_38_24]OGY88233.1 MAG: hypothetical protein A2319_03520 [Candidatus Kerfeldbacteria bacterium RIFOXYB2_FULL_38_14]
MKIAMIGQKGIPATWGGVETHVEALSTKLANFGENIIVYTRPYYTSAEQVLSFNKQNQHIQLVSLPTIKSKHFDTIVHTFLATCHAMWHKADIYHFHSVGPSLLSFLPKIFRPRARIITTFHCIDRQHAKWGFLARKILALGEWTATKFSHKTITVSRTLQYYTKEVFGAKTAYIPNGVYPATYLKPSIITAEFGLQKDDYVLFVGRLVAHKGVHNLISAFKKIATDKKLVIVGDSVHTDAYVKSLKKLAANDDRIIFTGFANGNKLKELFANAYLFVQPSESEGLSIALLEAASFGLPVLLSNIPANLEVVKENGFLFESGNVLSLQKQLQYLLGGPKDLSAFGKKLRLQVEKEYNWDVISLQTLELYKTVYRQNTQKYSRLSATPVSMGLKNQ